ncbi:MAG: hypothetical protein GDA56_04010 [Hormoscilla sp. GM7CHS1pb]|nr:hypothetical protein [Hormoscilla sp. GM7CHS1pb]
MRAQREADRREMAELRSTVTSLVEIVELHQRYHETSDRNFEQIMIEIREIQAEIREIQAQIRNMQAEIRGLQVENRRILERVFGPDFDV